MKLSIFKKSLLFILFITALTQGQFRRHPDFHPQLSPHGIYFEAIIVPDDSGAICYLPFRISYNSLVFIKEGEKFKAKYSITAEARDSLTKKVVRDIIAKDISVDSYDNTLEENLYSQGLLKLRLPNGMFTITPLITDVNASREQPGRSIRVRTDSVRAEIFQPVLIKSNETCDSIATQIVNYEGQIPYSNKVFDLLIPVSDTSVSKLDIEVINNDKSIIKTSLEEFFPANLELVECKDNIYITSRSGRSTTRNFVYHDFNQLLSEGKLDIKISYNNSFNDVSKSFNSLVRWFDKPFSMMNVPFSIRILKYVTDEQSIDTLLDKKSEKQYESLIQFWKRMDPTPKTAFNELMQEYYERVDYTMKNYSVVGSKNGAETDRGKIYIQFGKPDDIKRVYDDPNNIKEIWTYKNPERQFMFTDKTGLGNFILSTSS